jgi:hypothetical protein
MLTLNLRGGMDGFTHLFKGAAAANIAYRIVYIAVGRMRLVLEQSDYRHDYPALAIAALRNIMIDPGFLDAVQDAITSQSLNRQDLFSDRVPNLNATGSDSCAINV